MKAVELFSTLQQLLGTQQLRGDAEIYMDGGKNLICLDSLMVDDLKQARFVPESTIAIKDPNV